MHLVHTHRSIDNYFFGVIVLLYIGKSLCGKIYHNNLILATPIRPTLSDDATQTAQGNQVTPYLHDCTMNLHGILRAAKLLARQNV